MNNGEVPSPINLTVILILICALVIAFASILFINAQKNLIDKKIDTENDNQTKIINEEDLFENQIWDIDKITKYEFVDQNADKLLKEISYSSEEKKKYCTNIESETQNRSSFFPIDELYKNIPNLGQIFTIARCNEANNERIDRFWELNSLKFSNGLSLILNKEPSGELRADLINLEFSCVDGNEPDQCKKWTLKKIRNIKSLVILEPFIDYFQAEELI